MINNVEDLYTLASHSKGAEMQINGLDGKPVDMFITFVGIDSPQWEAITRKHRKAQIKVIKAGGDDRTVTVAMLAEAATGWRGFKSKGKVIKFSSLRIKELLTNAPYICDQADVFVGTRVNFMKG